MNRCCKARSRITRKKYALYPRDRSLADLQAESYCGLPLMDHSAIVVRHLAIFDDKPMWDGPRGIAIMRIFAARALAEVERMRAQRVLEASEERLSQIIGSAMDAIVTIDASMQVNLFNGAAQKIFRCSHGVPRETMNRLAAYEWPGNVRELENVIERAVIVSPGYDLPVASQQLPSMIEGEP